MKDGLVTQNLPSKLLVAYPNSGEDWDAVTRDWRGDSGPGAGQFGRSAALWADRGARLIGGCCRTTPEHITAIANSLAL